MQVIVPLAGPDFIRADGSLKALVPLEGGPLLRHVLDSRAWAGRVAPDAYTFVLADRAETRAFAADHLGGWYPGARTVFLSEYTQGAALSCLAGVAAAVRDADTPLMLDLADILYTCDLDPVAALAPPPDTAPDTASVTGTETGGVALTFASDNPVYSYLRREDGRVVEAAEKRVISDEASAGTYLFRNAPVFLRAIAHGLENAATQTHRDLFFVCPLFNGVIAQGLAVDTHPVTDIHDIKTA